MAKRNFAIFATYVVATSLIISYPFDDAPVMPVLIPAQLVPHPVQESHPPPSPPVRPAADDPFVQRNLYGGVPQHEPGIWPGDTEYVVREGYVLEHSSLLKVPLWVGEFVGRDQLEGEVKRKDRFRADPRLRGRKSTPEDYSRTGFDRGHQSPAANQKADAALNDETFYMSNMAPQVPDLNRGIWADLEQHVRDWILAGPEGAAARCAWVITGGMLHDPAEENIDEADGWIGSFALGENQVIAPTHFYKIVIGKDENGVIRCVAFVYGNMKYSRRSGFGDAIRSVDWIEKRTGLNFMPELDDTEEERLESEAPEDWLVNR